MIQATSTLAYLQTNTSREVMCKQLMNLYQTGDYTDNEAGRKLGWHPSEVSARRNDLGSVIYSQEVKKDSITGKTNKVWRLYKETLF